MIHCIERSRCIQRIQTLLQVGSAVLIDKMSFLIVFMKHVTSFVVTELLVYLIICPFLRSSPQLYYPWCGYTNLSISEVLQATDDKGNMCSCTIEHLSCQLWTIIQSVCLEHSR